MDFLEITEVIAYISASLAAILYIVDTIIQYHKKEEKQVVKPLPLTFRSSIKKKKKIRRRRPSSQSSNNSDNSNNENQSSPKKKKKEKTIIEISPVNSDLSPLSSDEFYYGNIYE